jgi:hypothetical protein
MKGSKHPIKENLSLTFVIFVAAVHQEKEVGASQEYTGKSEEAEGDWLKKLTDFAR